MQAFAFTKAFNLAFQVKAVLSRQWRDHAILAASNGFSGAGNTKLQLVGGFHGGIESTPQ